MSKEEYIIGTKEVNWPNSTDSDLIDIRGRCIVGISFANDAAINAKTIGFDIYLDKNASVGGWPMYLLDNSGAYQITSVQNTYLPLDPALFAGVEFVKVTGAASINGQYAWLHIRELTDI